MIQLKQKKIKSMKWWSTPYGKILIDIFGWIMIWLIFSSWFSLAVGWDAALKIHFILVVGMAGLVYLNSKILLPLFFIHKNYIPYFLLLVSAIVLLVNLTSSLDQVFVEHLRRRIPIPPHVQEIKFRLSPPTFMKTLVFSFAVFANTVYWMTQFAQRQKRLAIKLKSEKLEAEMKFLKSQINPHFLFNVLNNVYSLALSNSQHTAEVVMKLSEMLRYVLYEANVDEVPLDREIQYIQNFIDLQKLKDDETIHIDFEIETTEQEIQIAPMLLVTFVENAFKHGNIEDTSTGWIKIKIEANQEEVNFKIVNSLPTKELQKDKVGGIGLKNVQQRLKLLYPRRHFLQIKTNQQQFDVDLKIELV